MLTVSCKSDQTLDFLAIFRIQGGNAVMFCDKYDTGDQYDVFSVGEMTNDDIDIPEMTLALINMFKIKKANNISLTHIINGHDVSFCPLRKMRV